MKAIITILKIPALLLALLLPALGAFAQQGDQCAGFGYDNIKTKSELAALTQSLIAERQNAEAQYMMWFNACQNRGDVGVGGTPCDPAEVARQQRLGQEAAIKHRCAEQSLNSYDRRASDRIRDIYDQDRGFFTPKPGELSVMMLGRIFGTVGNILHGGGNQLLGSLIGIFNAAWVIAIGISIAWMTWTAVIAAAGSGEMMGGKGKKSIFTIIRIVVGFALVIPSATTGYSLAQVGVMWVAVQGVGMASRVSDRFHDFLAEGGGAVVPAQPLKTETLVKILPTSQTVLQSAICMYRLQDIYQEESKNEVETMRTMDEFSDVPGAASTMAGSASQARRVGYSINDNNTITFGTRNDGEIGPQYNSECGLIELGDMASLYGDLMALMEGAPDDQTIDLMGLAERTGKGVYFRLHYALTNSVTRDPMPRVAQVRVALEGLVSAVTMYQQLATIELITQLLPTARTMAGADVRTLERDDPNGILEGFQRRGSASMAQGTSAFATIIEPASRLPAVNLLADERARKARLEKMKDLGWLYTPLAVLDATRDWGNALDISELVPVIIGPDLGRITNISRQNAEALKAIVELPNTGYANLAEMYLYAMRRHLDFGRGTNFISNPNGWVSLSRPLDWMRIGTWRVGRALEGGVISAFNAATLGEQRNIAASGVNQSTIAASIQAGPIAPIMVALMGSVLGRNMLLLQNQVLNPPAVSSSNDAMKRLVYMGGAMIDDALHGALRASMAYITVGLAGRLVGLTVSSIAGWFNPTFGAGVQAVLDWLLNTFSGIVIFYIGFLLLFVSGGAMLYFFLPLIPVIAFFSMVINWFVMILINILGAPIFCFNLTRADMGEGAMGKGEKYIADIIRTMATPSVLVIGMVAFLLMFDTIFALLGSMLALLIPVLGGMFAVHSHTPFIGVITSVLILTTFGTMIMFLAQTLATLCSAHAVRTIGGMIGETVHSIAENMPHHEVKGAVGGAAGQVTARAKGTTVAAGDQKQVSGH